jgi:hypothetical protein
LLELAGAAKLESEDAAPASQATGAKHLDLDLTESAGVNLEAAACGSGDGP